MESSAAPSKAAADDAALPDTVKVILDEPQFVVDIACGSNHSAAITSKGIGTVMLFPRDRVGSVLVQWAQ